MARFAFYIRQRAIMQATVQIEANSEEEAREKYAEFLRGRGEGCFDQKDGDPASGRGDLKWEYEGLDDKDSPELSMVWEMGSKLK